VIVLVGATLLSMAPLLLLAYPIDELLAMSARLIPGGGWAGSATGGSPARYS
jgi:hypothetical protein